MKYIAAATVLCSLFTNAFAADLTIGKGETKLIYKRDLEGGIFLRLDNLTIEQGGKLMLGEPLEMINIHVKSLVAEKGSLIDLSGRRGGGSGAKGSDNPGQATYCHAGPTGGNGGVGENGENGTNAAILVDIKKIEGLTIHLSGASGGDGGAGGRGGRGGGARDSRLCREGDGGWGGTGGNGGRGGNAGELHFRWRNTDPTVCWTSANDRPPNFTVIQTPGPGGTHGAGGPGGPGRHQGSKGPNGSNGAPGSVGYLKVERIPSVDDAGICKK